MSKNGKNCKLGYKRRDQTFKNKGTNLSLDETLARSKRLLKSKWRLAFKTTDYVKDNNHPPLSTDKPIATVRHLYTTNNTSKYSDDHTRKR